jgi:hypothetical protein
MDAVYKQKKEEISKQMMNDIKEHELSKEHAEALSKSIKDIVENKVSCKSGKDTQHNSSENERSIGQILMANTFKEISKIVKKSKCNLNSITVTVFIEDYYGYKRNVSHKYTCTLEKPTSDGLYFISQPCGSQSSPDFLTFHYKEGNIISTFAIEYKGTAGQAKWNAHIQSMSRSIMYIIKRNDKTDCFFGEHLRNKESLLHALTHDEVLRELVLISNINSSEIGNINIARPSHEFKEIQLDNNYMKVIKYLNSYVD